MVINQNLLRHYRSTLIDCVPLDDVIDDLISKRIVDEKLYFDIWDKGSSAEQVRYLLDVILNNDRFSGVFIDILKKLSYMKDKPLLEDLDNVRDVIVTGGFPDIPPNYVERTSLANSLRKSIKELRSESGHNILVVHGLTGYGKSCLVNQVLQDKDFVELSGKAMFWINLGQYESEENLTLPMWMLYLNAANLAKVPPLTQCPDNHRILNNHLRILFLNERLRDALVILDDVKCSKAIEAFDISRKLIVTTQDANLVTDEKKNAKIAQVKEGFSKEETRELFKKSLEKNELSCEAELLHDYLFHGFPMLVNMVGSVLQTSKEEGVHNEKMLWTSILQELKRKDSSIVFSPQCEKVVCLIKKNVGKLKPRTQAFFHSLSCFPENVNIQSELLVELWEEDGERMNNVTVRSIMDELINKSLVVSFYHKDLKSYIYSVHSLVFKYLQEFGGNNEETVRKYHAKLIAIYDKMDAESLLKEHGNYLLGYFGYHLKNARMLDRFGAYFDFKFIEKKIRFVGCADLLRDYEIYEEQITKGSFELRNKLADYKALLSSYSSHFNSSPESIVQYALYYNNKNSYVFEEAMKIVENNQDTLYFKTQVYSGQQKYFSVLEVERQVITAACFTESVDVVILGTASGYIQAKSFHNHYDDYCKFEGHTSEVHGLEFSPDRKRFLSTSGDGTAKLWRYVVDGDPLSPRTKQKNWRDLHMTNWHSEECVTYSLDDDHVTASAFSNGFGDGAEVLITGSRKGKLIVWHKRARRWERPRNGLPITCVLFSHDDSEIFVSHGKTIDVYTTELVYKYQLIDEREVRCLVLDPLSRSVGSLHPEYLIFWNDKCSKIYLPGNGDPNHVITCVKVTNDRCLLIATDRSIYTYDLNRRRFSSFKNDSGWLIRSVAAVNDQILLVGTRNNKVQRRELPVHPEDKPAVEDLSLFACHWKGATPLYAIATKDRRRINVFKGNAPLSGTHVKAEEVTCLAFSVCGDSLLYGCRTGKVFQYSYKNNSNVLLADAGRQVALLKSFAPDRAASWGLVAATRDRLHLLEGGAPASHRLAHPPSALSVVADRPIVVDGNCDVFIVYDRAMRCVFANPEGGRRATGAAAKGHSLAVAFNEGGRPGLMAFQVYPDRATCRPVLETGLDCEPRSLCFSSDAAMLAVGLESGAITVFNIETEKTISLSLHQQPVEYVLFAPGPEPILVSLGDQVAWWNLKDFQGPTDDRETFSTDLYLDSWCNKRISDTVPFLLTSTSLHGKRLRFVSACKDFKSFLIVDNDGNIYKLDAIM